MKPLIIYHASCTDGFGAAYAAWNRFGDDAEYVPMHYGTITAPVNLIGMFGDTFADRYVFILDFSFPKEVMEWLFANSKGVTWLDHHKTAFEMWCPDGEREFFQEYEIALHRNTYITLDNNKSGAMLAWEYFHQDTAPPMVIKHIDDRDRWQFKLRGSREIHLALQAEQPWTFDQWAALAHPDNYGGLFSTGSALLKDQIQKVQHSAKKGTPVKIPVTLPDLFEGASVEGLVVNTPTFISEVGHELAVKSGTFGLVWYYDGESGRANCSLRSNGDYDVSAIAKLFSGGGHRNASGFNIDMPTLLEWMKG